MERHLFEEGNNIERSLAPLLRKYFPRYENFWSTYLMPLTGRPNDPNWRLDTYPDLEKIGIASFGIMKSISFINNKKDKIGVSGDPEQTFKNIYFHFGLAIDCVEALARSIVIIMEELRLVNIERKLKLSSASLLYYFLSWAFKDYSKSFKMMVSEGKPIFYYPQHNHDFLCLIISEKSKRRKYLSLTKKIKDYRNFFIHNPGVDVFMDLHSKKHYAIRKEKVNKSRNWATLRELYNIDKSDFIDPSLMIADDLHYFLTELNSIWFDFDKKLELIYNDKGFGRIFTGFKRQIT